MRRNFLDKLIRRTWLNKKGHHSTAFVYSKFTVDEWDDSDEECLGITGAMTLSDCSRQVTLDFNCWDTHTARNALYKLCKLEEEIKKAREFVEYWQDEVYSRDKKKGS